LLGSSAKIDAAPYHDSSMHIHEKNGAGRLGLTGVPTASALAGKLVNSTPTARTLSGAW